MSQLQAVKGEFLRITAKHKLAVVTDEGDCWRHLRCREPWGSPWGWDIIITPGYLSITGGLGEYKFQYSGVGIIEYFRGEINPQHWLERCVSSNVPLPHLQEKPEDGSARPDESDRPEYSDHTLMALCAIQWTLEQYLAEQASRNGGQTKAAGNGEPPVLMEIPSPKGGNVSFDPATVDAVGAFENDAGLWEVGAHCHEGSLEDPGSYGQLPRHVFGPYEERSEAIETAERIVAAAKETGEWTSARVQVSDAVAGLLARIEPGLRATLKLADETDIGMAVLLQAASDKHGAIPEAGVHAGQDGPAIGTEFYSFDICPTHGVWRITDYFDGVAFAKTFDIAWGDRRRRVWVPGDNW